MTALVHASDDVVASAAEMCIVESHVVKYLIIYGVKRGQSSGGVGIQPIVADSGVHTAPYFSQDDQSVPVLPPHMDHNVHCAYIDVSLTCCACLCRCACHPGCR